VTFEFPEHALTTVVGPSGSGKSSLLRLLAALDRPTSGELVVRGTPLHTSSHPALRRLRRRTIGYLFQRPSDNFLPHLTVGEHLRMAVSGSRPILPVDETELLRTLGIADRVDHLPSQLSGGEQQRAAIAQVLVGGAEIVVADEPTAELDTSSAGAVLETIHLLMETGFTFVLATHDPDVMRRSDVVLQLDHGTQVRGRAPVPSEMGVSASVAAPLPPTERADEPPIVQIHGIRKAYRRGEETVHALEDVDLALHPGELVGLVGRSGSGKTTLLNVVAGWEHPDAGVIEWRGDGRQLRTWREVAVLPQKLGLMDELTVRENIEYPARLTGTLDETADMVERLLEDLGLVALQHRFPRETSVGEQQRAALARALVVGPTLLLADEPTGHQDRVWTERVLSVLEGAAGRGTCCLIATHNEEVSRSLDRIARMSDGRLEAG
jgi:putative ABC transport system ATP-binding protein